ncbi:MAG TPA: hypothetical protein VF615_01800 [Longimicrobiaceae bacterium]|jgi:hypothetical protein
MSRSKLVLRRETLRVESYPTTPDPARENVYSQIWYTNTRPMEPYPTATIA